MTKRANMLPRRLSIEDLTFLHRHGREKTDEQFTQNHIRDSVTDLMHRGRRKHEYDRSNRIYALQKEFPNEILGDNDNLMVYGLAK